ncbi:hypothetical protein GI584_23035 [Gracilibacillus salitolerans]|uniref:Uncharacterized protein n=1 Tax=Gracilibacillus salitolerans TaxID=2663022 RepID=A0A5Q2TRL6_9BACI|nr:hypothetical protein [Gracilibacillus salitolerans]QGH36752.1 hypothetical protein GI584_23035 [Gracilibacillus salitolerans]
MTKDVIKVIKEAREHSEPFVTDALIRGVTRLSNEMNDVAIDVNQSPRMLLGKMAITLRNGAITTGKEMMTRGLERMQNYRT